MKGSGRVAFVYGGAFNYPIEYFLEDVSYYREFPGRDRDYCWQSRQDVGFRVFMGKQNGAS